MSKSRSKASKTSPSSRTARPWLWPAIIFASAFLLYSNSIHNFYALDDDIYTRKNEYISGRSANEHYKKDFGGKVTHVFRNLPNIFLRGSLMGFNKQNDANYRPLVLLDFLIETAIFDENPYVNHFFNVLFYALAMVVLYWFLLRLLKAYNPYIPLLITALYLLHPIHTDVVANIKSRDEILGFLFGMGSLLQLMKYTQLQKDKYVVWSVLLLFCSILCKENSLTFMVIIPVMLYTFTDFSIKKVALLTLPYVGLAGLYYLIRAGVLSSLTFTQDVDVVNNSLMGIPDKLDRIATNLSMMGNNLKLLLFPYSLSWDYSYNTFPMVHWNNIRAFGSILLYVAMTVYALLRVWKRDVYAFCIIFYLSTIILTSNLFIKILATYAERFLFLPSLGFCIALVFLLGKLFKVDLKASKLTFPSGLNYLLAALLVFYTFRTISRSPDWKTSSTLFEAGLQTQPNSARVHFAVASEKRISGEREGNPPVRQQRLDSAIAEYKEGMKIFTRDSTENRERLKDQPEKFKDWLSVNKRDPEIYFNMGITYADMGRRDSAEKYYNQCLQLKPSYGGARNNLGVYYFNDKNYEKALAYFKGVVKYDSAYADAYSNIGACYDNTGLHKEALAEFKQAVKFNKDGYAVYDNMARTSLFLRDSLGYRAYTDTASQIRSRLELQNRQMPQNDHYPFTPVTILVLCTIVVFGISVYLANNKHSLS
ncbi:MAG TPA: tetratricopeptide repeat protein [Bacteroidia bacterium]|jgi:tetratricopeptide (TPR) repeat protein|nr:tetratricopeptide repeat protein [Bacteroidia bacterium]